MSTGDPVMPHLPPITAGTPDDPAARDFTRSLYTARTHAGFATYRLFHGGEPRALSVKDQVAVAVAERIVRRELAPGQKIPEQSIADEFSVSKAPVSEALMLLEFNGLVEAAARRSAHVAPMNEADFMELMEYRTALVGVAFARFLERHGPADREVLRQYLEHMKELAGDDARTFEFAELADRSILYMSVQSGNRRIARAMFPLSLQLLRYYPLGLATARARRQVALAWGRALAMGERRDQAAFRDLAARTRSALVDDVVAALRAPS